MYRQTALVDSVSPVAPPSGLYTQTSFHAAAVAPAGADSREAQLELKQMALLDAIAAQIKAAEAAITARGGRPHAGPAAVKAQHHAGPAALVGVAATASAALTATLATPTAPLATLAVLQHARTHGAKTVQLRQFWHSTLPASAVAAEATLAAERRGATTPCDARLALIWKAAGPATFVMSASAHTPIEGDANAARFLARTLAPELYPEEDVLLCAQTDNWVDRAEELTGSSRNQKSILKEANATLGQNAFLSGAAPGLGDMVFWAAMRTNDVKSPPSNIKKWLVQLEALPAFAAALAAVNMTPAAASAE